MTLDLKRPSWEALLLAALLAANLAPLWLLPIFPAQDGHAHMEIANILREYGRPEGQVLRDVFEIDRGVFTNGFIYYAMADWLRFLPVPAAEKVLLSAYVILLPLSVAYAVRAVEPKNAFLAALAVPFTYTYPLAMGFYNFCFGLAALFFGLGFWLRHRRRFGPRQALGLFAIALWAYSCHVIALGLLTGAIGILGTVELFRKEARPVFRNVAWTAAALLPCLFAANMFLNQLATHTASHPMSTKLYQLVSLHSLAIFDDRTRWLAGAYAAVLALATLWTLIRGRSREFALLLVVAAFTGLALLTPSNVGIGGFIHQRLTLVPWFVLILWLGTFDHTPARRRVILASSTAMTIGMLALFWPRWSEINDQLDGLRAAEARIEPGSTLLHLSYSHFGIGEDGQPLSYRIKPFLHAGSRIGARQPVGDLRLYAARYPGYFPVRYRRELSPYGYLTLDWREEKIPQAVDILGYTLRTGGRIDYVLLWQMQPELEETMEMRVLREHLQAYEQVHASPGLELWRLQTP